jgi:hypothetical protein
MHTLGVHRHEVGVGVVFHGVRGLRALIATGNVPQRYPLSHANASVGMAEVGHCI